jgi:hypothetical protein
MTLPPSDGLRTLVRGKLRVVSDDASALPRS